MEILYRRVLQGYIQLSGAVWCVSGGGTVQSRMLK
jgi:hypothetical protein